MSALPTINVTITIIMMYILHLLNYNHNCYMTVNAFSSSTNNRNLLETTGNHFKLNRFTGDIEFGSTFDLVTKFYNTNNSNNNNNLGKIKLISKWMSDDQRLALSIWDPKLIKPIPASSSSSSSSTKQLRIDSTTNKLMEQGKLYRLQLMTLQFFTIQLAPTVDILMYTQYERNDNYYNQYNSDINNNNAVDVLTNIPHFQLQSIGFDPNVQLLPGLKINTQDLNLQINVQGELRPSPDGLGVTGKIGFRTVGTLPPPMRLFPEGVLQSTSGTICKTIMDFAVSSFKKGSIGKYREFCQLVQQEQQKQKEKQQQQQQQVEQSL